MPQRPFSLERRVTIDARRETVFRYFTDSERFARWWGEGSQIDPKPGGEVVIRTAQGPVTRGKVLEIEPPHRIAFTYGLGEMDPEESVVTVTFDEAADGTHVHLRHDFASEPLRNGHVQGWRHQLALFAKIATEEQHGGAAARVDDFLRAFGHPDAATRRALLAGCAADGVEFRDAFSATAGLDDLLANLDAVQIFMPGITLERAGEIRLSHGTALVDWAAKKADGGELARGTNVFELDPDGRIRRVTGFWG